MTNEKLSISVSDDYWLSFKSFPDSLRDMETLGKFTVEDSGITYSVNSVCYPQKSFPNLYLPGRCREDDDKKICFTYDKEILNGLINFLRSFCADKGIAFEVSAESMVLGGL